MQYSGSDTTKDQKDCPGYGEGKEIYEGDIICNKEGRKYQVYVCPVSGTFFGLSLDKERHTIEAWKIKHDILGNIYENPELLNDSR